ncbi:protein-tyrosine phosphatase-like protein [Aspergillus californicus]
MAPIKINIPREEPLSLLKAEGVFNLRGLGGYPCTVPTPGWTRRSHIFRSGHPGDLTPAGVQTLKGLDIKFIINLTSPGESAVTWKLPRRVLEEQGLVFIDCPIQKEVFSVDGLLEKYGQYKNDGRDSVTKKYIDLIATGAPVIKTIARLIIDHPNDGKLIHCSLGKDRTGVTIALLLMLSGVPDSLIIKDYALSTAGLIPTIPQIERYLVKAKGKSIDARKRAEEMIVAREEYMAATIRALREIYGDVANYLITRCDMSVSDVWKLEAVLVS